MKRGATERPEDSQKDQAFTTRLIDDLMNLAHLLTENNDHEKAGQLYEKALVLQKRISVSESSAIAEILYFQGINLTILEQNERAKTVFNRALSIEQSLTTHPGLTRVLVALGKLIIDQDPKTAKGYFEQALENQKKHHGTNTIGVAKILLELGCAHEMLGDPRTAQNCYQQSLEIQDAFYRSHNNMGIARALSGIGAALSSLGQYEDAKKYLEKALKTQGYVDQNHPVIMNIKLSLANVLIPLGKLHQAQQMYDDILKRLGDQETASHAIILTNYANVLALLDKQGLAIRLLKDAIAIGLRHYPENHPVLAMTHYTLGDILVDKHPQDAIPHLEKSLEIRKNYYGERHQKVAVVLRALGWAYKTLGNLTKAVECLESARVIFHSNNLRTQETEVRATLTEIQQRQRQMMAYQGQANPAAFLSGRAAAADTAAPVITMDNIPALA